MAAQEVLVLILFTILKQSPTRKCGHDLVHPGLIKQQKHT